MTKNKIEAIIRRNEELEELVNQFVKQHSKGSRWGDSRINNQLIEQYVNTACHCHPEYEWMEVASLSEFIEWIENIKS